MESKICINCEFCEQREMSSFCGNKKQDDKDLKRYVYYNFSCNLFIKGISKSRIEYQLSVVK